MIGYFKERSSLQVPALLLLAILLKVGYVSAPVSQPMYMSDGGMLAQWLNSNSGSFRPGFLFGFGLVALMASVLYGGFVTSNRRMFAQRHVLVPMSMLLFSSLFPFSNVMLPALLVLPLLIGTFASLTRLYQSEHPRTSIINAGILSGLGYLLYHPFIWVLPGCFIGLAFMRPFRLAEWVLLLAGMLTPVYFVLATEFLTNHWHPASHLPTLGHIQWPTAISWYGWLCISMALVWLLAGFNSWQQQTRRMVIQGRKNWYSLLMMGLFMLPGLLLPQGNTAGMLALLSFPAGSLMANAFVSEGKGIGQLLFFWLLVIVVAVAGWGWKTGLL